MKFASSVLPEDYRRILGNSGEILTPYIETLNEYVKSAESEDEISFLTYPDNQNFLEEIEQKIKTLKTLNLKYIFIIGIGGANLASKAVYDALEHGTGTAKAIFFDTIGSHNEGEVESLISKINTKEEWAVCIISKSGTTVEVLSNAEILLNLLEKKFGVLDDRLVVITAQDSALWNEFMNGSALLFKTPNLLGDRFSAFSAGTLVPLFLLGFDVKIFLEGAHNERDKCLAQDISINNAFNSATVLNYWLQKNKDILDFFLFSPKLETLGKWHRQLFAESLGKELTLIGSRAKLVYTPMVSIGTTDLHSMLQLNLSQPENKLTHFVSCDTYNDVKLDDSKTLGDIDKNLVGKSTDQVVDAIYNSVKASYLAHNHPFVETKINAIREKELGEYMMYAMLTTLYLGKLWNLNVFDQPNVEEYKASARETLKI